MNKRIQCYFSTLVFGAIIVVSAILEPYKGDQLSSSGNCNTHNIDSLKWMIYSLNFEYKAKHFKYDSLPEADIPECNVKLFRRDTSISDTVAYYFSFFKENEFEPFNPKMPYRVGIGYSCISKKFFPISSGGFPVSVKGSSHDNYFFNQERKFIRFLKQYTGYISPWLKAEAIRRGVL